MYTTLEQTLAELSPERRQRILEEADRLQQEYQALTIKQIRKEKNLTQQKLADLLGIRQASIAATENQQDFLISTLRKFLSAMGGDLDLVAQFPNEDPIIITGIGGNDDQTVK